MLHALVLEVMHNWLGRSNTKMYHSKKMLYVALLLTWFAQSVNVSVALVNVAHTIEKDSSSGGDIQVQRRCDRVSLQCRHSTQKLQAEQPCHVAPHLHHLSFCPGEASTSNLKLGNLYPSPQQDPSDPNYRIILLNNWPKNTHKNKRLVEAAKYKRIAETVGETEKASQ